MDSSTIALLVVLAVLTLTVMALSGGQRGAVLAAAVVALTTAAVWSAAMAHDIFPGLVGGTFSSTEVTR